MSETPSVSWASIRATLKGAFPAFYELEAGGSLLLDLGGDGWLLEVKPDGGIVCQYGVAMDDVMSLMSEGTPEDLGTDEVAKQAKYFIQPAVAKFRPLLARSGFAEATEMDKDHVAVTFTRSMDLAETAKVEDLIRWCMRHIGTAA